ncbi:unnamed protein product [Rotaria sp. Silwood1]|nr:unnamed protein product [Rotaria sp. Silwood1]CAF1275047.1 unnamed protein product [Rotaria sp. Silwood1]CAF3520711.1 unnamed protein product [Rotaria sp. Silwood1]CAF4697507.1 unnamed protein product [Rotaria sp. Silwood1]
MTTSTKTQQLYGEYINPTIDQYSPQKESPLVLMAQACNNIGKELSISSSPPLIYKTRKSNSPQEIKKSLKRIAPTTCSSPPAKKSCFPQVSYYPSSSSSSSFMFDSLFYYHLNKTFSLPTFDLSFLSTSPLNSSAFSFQPQQSSYLMDSILSSPFICNWMDTSIPDRFCGKRFTNHIHLFEHLCTEHTSISSIKSLYPSYYSSTSVEKL